MRNTLLILLAIIFTAPLFSQSTITVDFNKFLESRTQENGMIQFESLCSMDNIVVEDIDTGEFVILKGPHSTQVSKSDDFQIDVIKNFVSASFTAPAYNSSGDEMGKNVYTIEFLSEGSTFVISAVTFNKTKWKKNGDCWSSAGS